MEITFINVGYGESILITCENPECEGGQFVMLIDGGSNMDQEYRGESGRIRAIDYLKKKGILHIDLLVFTHIHEDHTSGLVPVINSIPVKKFWTSIELSHENYGKQIITGENPGETNLKALDSINAYSRLMDQLDEKDITWLDGIHPDYFKAGDLSIDILGPERNYKRSVEALLGKIYQAGNFEELNAAVTETTEAMNNASLILRLHYKGKTVLLCGDTNAQGFGHIFETDPGLLRADVYKIGHHGQPDSVTEELVRAVDPDFIVCCASNDHRSNSSNEITFETIQRAKDGRKISYLFQDGCYNEKWNSNTAPRNGVVIHIDHDSISWDLA